MLLEARLRAGSAGAVTAHAGCGLRLDQAAAAFAALTSARRAEVLAGPAGSGKTWTVAGVARTWCESGAGEAVGLATSQTAANVLAGAGVARACNTAGFLGHTQGRREAPGALPAAPGSLGILGEASMMSPAGLAAVLAVARRHGCKLAVTGGRGQLAAVEGGGGMMMLARQNGLARLAEPRRFSRSWQRDATLRPRAGDVAVLAGYREHCRLCGGSPEGAAERAYRGWLADCLAGGDSLLMARTGEQARELSRRARDGLIRYCTVAAAPLLRPAGGARASSGDLVMARRNVWPRLGSGTGRPVPELANRDGLRVASTAAAAGGMSAGVRRLLGRDAGAGRLRWSGLFCVPHGYLAGHACLA